MLPCLPLHCSRCAGLPGLNTKISDRHARELTERAFGSMRRCLTQDPSYQYACFVGSANILHSTAMIWRQRIIQFRILTKDPDPAVFGCRQSTSVMEVEPELEGLLTGLNCDWVTCWALAKNDELHHSPPGSGYAGKPPS
jgi:hypothetical protein